MRFHNFIFKMSSQRQALPNTEVFIDYIHFSEDTTELYSIFLFAFCMSLHGR
jgi:hypothetical protein